MFVRYQVQGFPGTQPLAVALATIGEKRKKNAPKSKSHALSQV
jgi:hypothetical protein